MYGINKANVKKGLIPMSLQRLAVTANTNHVSPINTARMKITPNIIPNMPAIILNALINPASNSMTYEHKLTAQYSLLVLVP